MIYNKKIVVVLPAFNADRTLEKTYNDIPFDIVDDVILVDDCSTDRTFILAQKLGISHILKHDKNIGYGANQKTCYNNALALDADIIVMLHPDYQYTAKLIHSMCYLIANNVYEIVLGSRILGHGALKGGMPLYKYFFNRVLTLFQNIMMGQKLAEYHTGYRAFTANVLKSIKYENNSDNFIFDNQLIAQICFLNYEIAEITCPTNYSDDSSSVSLRNSIIYGFGVVSTSVLYFLAKKLNIPTKLFGNLQVRK